MYYCLWKDARIVQNLKSLHVPSLNTGTISNNPPSTYTVVIIASILVPTLNATSGYYTTGDRCNTDSEEEETHTHSTV